MKADCHKCKHRRNIPGDTHSSCRHPKLSGFFEEPLAELITILGKRCGCGDIILEAVKDIKEFNKDFAIEANEHGIKKGWFIWPFNFDPAWLENCNAFEEK